jgi:hydrogenase nickel incorporation protein HypA/HybF
VKDVILSGAKNLNERVKMHEASIAASLIEIVLNTAEENNSKKVNKVFAKIGRLAAVEIDALLFAYDAIKDEYPTIAESELIIEDVPITGKCQKCGAEDTYEEMFFACSKCGSFEVKLLTGEELTITEIEVD